MKSSLDIVTDVWGLLNTQEVHEAITGKVWKFARSANSDKVDIVIGLLGANNDPLQQATLNVMIHLPNRIDVVDGKEDYSMPDIVKLEQVTNIITPLLDCQWRDSFHTDIGDTYLRQNSDGTWFNRIVVNYYAYNENFKNI